MVGLTRRGFLKLAALGAALANPALAVFREEPVEVLRYKDWIRDMGNYIQVTIPAGKTLSGQFFDKPVLLIAGEGATLRGSTILGFCNAYGKRSLVIDACEIDSSHMLSLTDPNRSVLKLGSPMDHVWITSCCFYSNGGYAIQLPGEAVVGTLQIDECSLET